MRDHPHPHPHRTHGQGHLGDEVRGAEPTHSGRDPGAYVHGPKGHDRNHQGHGHAGEHEDRRAGVWGRLAGVFSPHSHDAVETIDPALTSSVDGIRALKISLTALALTAAFQVVIVAVSGSVALLGDTIHNFADALTAIPLGIAFDLGRRPPTKR